jgi:hypothetical protein
MISPALAIAWEVWRKNRTGHLVALALIPASVILFETLTSVFPAARALPNSPSPAWSWLLLPMIGTLVWGFNVFAHTEGDAHRGFSGVPYRMFTLPVGTGFLVGCLSITGVLVISVTYLVWALVIRQIAGYPLPLAWPVTSLATTMACFQAVVWGLASFPWIRVFVITAGGVGVIALNAMLAEADLHQNSRELVWNLVVVACLPVAITASFFGVRGERRGGWRPWAGVRPTLSSIINSLPRRTRPFTTSAQAQLWFEWRRRGFFLSVALALSITGAVVFYFPFVSIAESAFPLVATLVYPVIVAGIAGTGLAKSDFWLKEVALQPFHAIRPITGGDLLAAKLKAAAAIVTLGWLLALPMVIALLTWPTYREMWHVDDSLGRLWHWLPGNPVTAGSVGLLTAGVLMAICWKSITSSLCLGLTGNRRLVTLSSFISLGIVIIVLTAGGWLCEHPGQIRRFQPALFLATGLTVAIKLLGTARSFVTAHQKQLLPWRGLTTLALIWLTTAGLIAAFAAVLWLGTPMPKPILLLVISWLWPAGELPQSAINLYANRHR